MKVQPNKNPFAYNVLSQILFTNGLWDCVEDAYSCLNRFSKDDEKSGARDRMRTRSRKNKTK
jgi:hypothetical protein